MHWFMLFIAGWFALCGSSMAGEREQNYFDGTMYPLAKDFLRRNALSPNADFNTNEIDRLKVDFFQDRPGAISSLRLTNKTLLGFYTEGTNSEVRSFNDLNVRPFLDYAYGPSERLKGMRTLNLGNKLTDQAALPLLKKCFLDQGHNETNFHPAEFRRMTDGVKGESNYIEMPFYEAQWYRKDVKQADRDAGYAALPRVHIIISGLATNLVYYSKLFMPVGADFESSTADNK